MESIIVITIPEYMYCHIAHAMSLNNELNTAGDALVWLFFGEGNRYGFQYNWKDRRFQWHGRDLGRYDPPNNDTHTTIDFNSIQRVDCLFMENQYWAHDPRYTDLFKTIKQLFYQS